MISSAYTNGLELTYLKGTRDVNKIEKHPTYENALAIYRKARERLLDVNAWKYDRRLTDFKYALMDDHDRPKYGFASDGDFIRFKADENDDMYSWVLVERVLEVSHGDWKSFAMRLKSITPVNGLSPFEGHSQCTGNTNTLIIERNGSKVVAYVHQRTTNVEEASTEQGFFSLIHKFFFSSESQPNQANANWESLIDIIME